MSFAEDKSLVLEMKRRFDVAAKRYPFWADTVRYHRKRGIDSAISDFSRTMDKKLFRTLADVAELDKQGGRKHVTLYTHNADTLLKGATDLYTTGNSGCMITIADAHSMGHIAIDFNLMDSVAKRTSLQGAVEAVFGGYFQNTQVDDPPKQLAVFPGVSWKGSEATELRAALKSLYRQTEVFVGQPGIHTAWVGQSPYDKSVNLWASYNMNTNRLQKNF